MGQTGLHKHSLSKKEQAVSSGASRASVRDRIDEFQDVYGSRAESAAFRQQLGSDFSQSGQIQPTIQAKPSFRGLSQELAPIQAKLMVGPANDIYEQEADRVAAQVVQRIHTPVSNSLTQGESVQRQKDEEGLQMRPITPIQRKDMSAGGEVSTDLESEINHARGGGQPLAPEMQLKMGEAMGADFSGVRVHRSEQADKLTRAVGARAFTTGQDLFFKRGEYQPGSRGGQELIAHELTHVVQQNMTQSSLQCLKDSFYPDGHESRFVPKDRIKLSESFKTKHIAEDVTSATNITLNRYEKGSMPKAMQDGDLGNTTAKKADWIDAVTSSDSEMTDAVNWQGDIAVKINGWDTKWNKTAVSQENIPSNYITAELSSADRTVGGVIKKQGGEVIIDHVGGQKK
ncbi:MAG: DUF4157 domain-containing protein [Snowella sp.]|nr:DUF4157 domain-containing protein [Snowella sp.]